MTMRWASSGALRCQPLRVPSIGSTALSSPARRSAQRVEDPCGSASTRTVRCPDNADCAARWVAIVVLPTPPLELATSTVFMRFLSNRRNDPRGYTGPGTAATGRPRRGRAAIAILPGWGTGNAGCGLEARTGMRAAARRTHRGPRAMIELQQVHRRYAMSGQTVHAL